MLNIDNILKNIDNLLFNNNYFLVFLLLFSIFYISFIKPNYLMIHNIIYNLNLLILILIFIYISYGINKNQKIYIIISLFLIKVLYLNINNINLQSHIIDLYFKKNINKNINNKIIEIQINMLPRKKFFGGKIEKTLSKKLQNKKNDLYSLFNEEKKPKNIKKNCITKLDNWTNEIDKLIKNDKNSYLSLFTNEEHKNKLNTWNKITSSFNTEFENKGGNTRDYNKNIVDILEQYKMAEENLELE